MTFIFGFTTDMFQQKATVTILMYIEENMRNNLTLEKHLNN